MTISLFLAELKDRNRLLYWVGFAHLILLALMIVLYFIDHRTVLGVNTWIKPMKFALSIAIYLWTFGWILHYLPDSDRWVKGISWGIAICMIAEMVCIVWQSARGVRSHFNIDSAFDIAIFATMGNFIALNTFLIILTFILLLIKKPNLEPAYLLSLRLGLFIFILASAVGGLMISNGAHSIGIADGGPGLPFVNWSKKGGDLRIAHFMGMHALQILPLFGYYLGQRKPNLPIQPRLAVVVVALVYTCVFALLFWQSMLGRPLIHN